MQSTSTNSELGGEIVIGGDLRVKRFGFGAMRITGKGVWGPPPDRIVALDLLKHVVRRGVNFIDTADSYGPGVSEELIAEALHPYPKDLVIATKAGLTRTGPNQWPIDAHPDRLKKCCDESLKRLRLERIDLYQLHRIDPHVPVEESLGALRELQTAGKIRHIGISQVSVDELKRCRELVDVVSVQNMYNLGQRESESVLKACEKDGLAFLPWFPIGGGEQIQHGVLEAIAKRYDATIRQISLAWLLHHSPVMLPIAGTSSIAHFDENLAATEITLTADDIAKLDSIAR